MTAVSDATARNLLFTGLPCSSLPSHCPARLCIFLNASRAEGTEADWPAAAVVPARRARVRQRKNLRRSEYVIGGWYALSSAAQMTKSQLFLPYSYIRTMRGKPGKYSNLSRQVVFLAAPPIEELDAVGPW